eukprot:93558-Hanusia_phi.AAC.1
MVMGSGIVMHAIGCVVQGHHAPVRHAVEVGGVHRVYDSGDEEEEERPEDERGDAKSHEPEESGGEVVGTAAVAAEVGGREHVVERHQCHGPPA